MQVLASQSGEAARPVSASMAAAYTPPSAPMPTPTAICQRGRRRASGRLSAQPTTSHSSVAGSATPVTSPMLDTQPMNVTGPYISATASTASTNSTARRITPTSQASNTSTGAGGGGAGGSQRSVRVDRICESFMGSSSVGRARRRPSAWARRS